jgi:hypothetical protein
MPELTRRYIVMAMATDGPFDMRDPDAPFVLKPWKDPAALRALETYRDHCYPELAQELGAWIEVIASGPPLRGGVGARNEAHAAARAKSRPALARKAAGSRPGARSKAARPGRPRKRGKRPK